MLIELQGNTIHTVAGRVVDLTGICVAIAVSKRSSSGWAHGRIS